MGIWDYVSIQLLDHIKKSWLIYLIIASALYVVMNPLEQGNFAEDRPVQKVIVDGRRN